MTQLLGWIVAAGVTVLAGLFIIPKELWSRWCTRLVDRIDHSLRRRTTRFGQRYREYLLSNLRHIDLKGLATVGFYTPELDEVFVDVSLFPRPPHLVQDGVLSQIPQDATDRHSLDEFLARPRMKILAVLGGPGTGKTTLLRHTAQEICRRRKTNQVPVLLYLRDHVTTVVGSPNITLPDLIRTTMEGYGADEPPGWFEQQLREGHCVILLDGLDEVAKEDDRRRLSSWVERQTKQYPQNYFVITSRPQGYRSAPICGDLVLQVRNFTEDQISRFVHGWYLAMERHSTGTSGDEIRRRAESASNDLLQRLRDAPALEELTVNPLLLTMIANVHRYRGALPGSRSDLYGEICEVMLWRRAEAKDMPLQLNGDKKESLLRGLAFTMMRQHVRDLPRAEILRELDSALRRVSTTLTAEAFLADATTNGLLVERESGVFSFAHLTFQEYLASAHIRDKGCVQVLVDAVNDIWWRETTLLYAAKSDTDPIVEACLRSANVTTLLLAFDCVDQGSELAPELRDDLKNILYSEQTDPELRKAQAGLRVARHLRRHIRTKNGGRVCAQPITSSIFQLFTAANPGHSLWQSSGTGDEPVTGVHGAAATAFVQWANSITDGDPGYRLPYASEITDDSVLDTLSPAADLTIWTAEQHGQAAELWTPPGTDHPYSVSRVDLVRHIAADLSEIPETVDRARLARSYVIATAAQAAFAHGSETCPNNLIKVRNRIRDLLNVDTPTENILWLADEFDYGTITPHEFERNMDRVLALCLRRAVRNTIPRSWRLSYTRAIEQVFAGALDIARDRVDDLHALIGKPCAQIMGHGLSRALSRARGGTSRSPRVYMLAVALLTEAGITEDHTHVSPDVLRTARPLTHGSWLNKWALNVTSQLDESVSRLNKDPDLLGERRAAAIRLPALCLAAETAPGRNDDIASEPFHEWMRQIPACVTLLERRATGTAQATETLMLATS